MAIPITKEMKLKFNGLDDLSKEAAKDEIKEYIVDTILDYVSKAKSPVKDGKWSALSPEYKKIKKKISGSTKANMELYGDMLDDLTARFDGDKLIVGFDDDANELSKLKAENHNKFTTDARKTKLPERNFIPRKTQKFKKTILRDIENIIDEYRD